MSKPIGSAARSFAIRIDASQRLPAFDPNINALALKDRQKIIATVQRAKDRGAMVAHTLSAARDKFPIRGAIFLLDTAERLGTQTRREFLCKADHAVRGDIN
ncbi:MAG: hypothetical protein AB7L90_24940 [Hyphomicrobiaceae bacterium]